jgi:hypothetical protein
MARRGRAWKLERTVVHRKGRKSRSNRYSRNDGPKPAPRTRKQYWHSGNRRYQRNPWYDPNA